MVPQKALKGPFTMQNVFGVKAKGKKNQPSQEQKVCEVPSQGRRYAQVDGPRVNAMLDLIQRAIKEDPENKINYPEADSEEKLENKDENKVSLHHPILPIPISRPGDASPIEISTANLGADETKIIDGSGEIIDLKNIVYPRTMKEKAEISKLIDVYMSNNENENITKKIIQFVTPNFFLMVGESWAGKSHMIEYLLKSLWLDGRFAFGIVFAPTVFNNHYAGFIKRGDSIIESFTDEKLGRYLNHLKALAAADKRKRMSYEGPEAKGEVPPNYIVFEDVVGSVNQNSRIWTGFVSTYRHYNTTVFIATQDLHRVHRLVRKQALNVFLWQLEEKGERETIYKTFGSAAYPRQEEFERALDEMTKIPFSCMLVRRQVPRHLIRERYMTMKAPAEIDESIYNGNSNIELPIKINF